MTQVPEPTPAVAASSVVSQRLQKHNVRSQWKGGVSNEMIAVVAGVGQSPSNYLGRMAAIQRLPAVLSRCSGLTRHTAICWLASATPWGKP
ncbi:MAG: hypothetical protein WCR06_03895 [bacterium]